MNDATGINMAYARGARITLAIGVALGLFLLPLLRAQEPMVEAEAEGQLLVDQQRIKATFAQLKYDNKLPGIRRGDNKAGQVMVSEVTDETRNEAWFVDSCSAALVTGKDKYYAVNVSFSGKFLKYIFRMGSSTDPELVVVCQRAGEKWQKIWGASAKVVPVENAASSTNRVWAPQSPTR
jgi:hypothetical protein